MSDENVCDDLQCNCLQCRVTFQEAVQEQGKVLFGKILLHVSVHSRNSSRHRDIPFLGHSKVPSTPDLAHGLVLPGS